MSSVFLILFMMTDHEPENPYNSRMTCIENERYSS